MTPSATARRRSSGPRHARLLKTASYNANNQFSGSVGNSGSYQYDNAGDVIQDPLNAYRYDGEGRLCAVKNSNQSVYQYVYDAEGRRTAKATLSQWPSSCLAPSSAPGFTAQALYLRGSGGMQTTELTGTGTWVHTNFFSGPAPMATYASSGATFAFHLTDYLGSRRLLANAQGAILETCQNLPYGNGNPCATSPMATEHLFTGKEHDTESVNDYFEARYYTSTAGRFMSPDWSAKISPVPYATMDDPQTLNLYAYVRNNPITGMDPDGHMSNADFSQMFMQGLAAQAGAFLQQQADQAAQAQAQAAWNNFLSMFLASLFFPSGDGGDPQPAQQQNEQPTVQGVAASATYGSKKAAAMAAEKAGLGRTREDIKKQGKRNEYGGWVISRDGAYTYTVPVTFGQDSHFYAANVTVPDGYSSVGWYHTHPDSGPEGEGFSEGDINFSNQIGKTGYVGMSYSGNVRQYVPSTPGHPGTQYNGYNGVTGDLIGNIP
ncbi:MAG: RHS repeat-associated core domain-containing protein [Terracidiphilus sp.]